uniref:Glycosyltransferase 2-like domain-containing protein n=1 Tax=viral metagenome TaxID=1070528 RepID=A0A6C0B083_9ZZZZ
MATPKLTKKMKESNKNIYKNKHEFPFVSICTPTFNRRPFISTMIQCFEHQTYPKDRMEWIIIDDGTDKIEKLVTHIPQVKYFGYEKKMTLGQKRNLMHEKTKGDIIIYMDDDDYYPIERVSHAVEMLKKNPSALCAGSSEMHIYFKHIQKMVQFGPYGPNHATAATFAFRRELLKQTRYEETASLAEERHFLKGYTIPFVQLDSTKTILVFSHNHNTFDKKTLLNNPNQYVKDSVKTIDDFIKEPAIKEFFMDTIDTLLELYEPGRPEHKPDVLKQLEKITEERKKQIQQQQQMQSNPTLMAYQQKLQEQTVLIKNLSEENTELKSKNEYLENKMKEIIQKSIQEKMREKMPEK